MSVEKVCKGVGKINISIKPKTNLFEREVQVGKKKPFIEQRNTVIDLKYMKQI